MQIIPTEYQEGCALAEYCRLKGYLFSHIAQETFTKSWGVKMKNKRQGVNKGVPDYVIIIKNKLAFIELKRLKNSKTSPEQLQWITELNKSGAHAAVCKGLDEAIEFINKIAK